MTREEQIIKSAKETALSNIVQARGVYSAYGIGFLEGAKWADEHPYKEKMGPKQKKLVELADAMYYAAQNLTTDASRLRKAMEEYHNFIIYEL